MNGSLISKSGFPTLGGLLLLTSIAGCGMNSSTKTSLAGGPSALTAGSIAGRARGGQQPVVGATIQLYEIGQTGYPSAAKPILTSSVLTVAGGTFSITGDYTCDAGSYVYITASGGNPGS